MVDKKRMFAFPSDERALIRFLPDVHLEHFINMKPEDTYPKIDLQRECIDSTVDGVRVNLESGENPFSPYPFSSLYSYGQVQAMNALRQNLNVLEIKTKRVAIPKRKKKSWLRYTSNKKWSRKFVPKYVRVAGAVKVLSIGGDFIQKLRNIVKDSNLVHGRMSGA